LAVELGRPEQVSQQRLHLAAAERLEVKTLARPAGSHVEQVRSREDEDEDRRAVTPADEIFHEIEERRLRPVQVLEHEHERPGTRHCLEELAYGPESLLRAHIRLRAQQSDE